MKTTENTEIYACLIIKQFPSEVAEAIFRAVSGKIKVVQGGDVDVWRVMSR